MSDIGHKAGRRQGKSEISKANGKTRTPRLFSLQNILICASVFSVYQYATTGKVSWVTTVYESVENRVTGYATRPEAGWRKAADAIEDLGAAREAAPTEFDITGKVVRIVNGDTVHVFEGDGVQTRIDLYGIDAPNRDQDYYTQAGDALAGMIAGEEVGVAVVEHDKSGRAVGTIYLDGKNINRAMVQRGYAWWYRKSARYDRALQEAERYARAQELGLWADPDPVPPWEWRRAPQ